MSYIDPPSAPSNFLSMFGNTAINAATSASSLTADAFAAMLKRLNDKRNSLSSVSVPGVPDVGAQLEAKGIDGKTGEAIKSKFAQRLDTFGTGIGILGDIAGIYQGFQANKLAKQQFGANRAFANANLENTIKSYNTRLGDIYNARGYTQGNDPAATQAAITANSLNFRRI